MRSCQISIKNGWVFLIFRSSKTIFVAKPRIGICSNYVKNLKVGDEVAIHVTDGTFRLPPAGDLVMIGPGTGMGKFKVTKKSISTFLAPFRSIIQDRQKRKVDQSESLLFFGCRHPEKDLYFKNEFDDLQRFNAFSRLEVRALLAEV